ncbi:CTP--2,3-di-O-geranylgeranyl-sn-glycero-1-phosphate cytidyltransferase, partial [Candidatus Woesearchaeota archaeon]|nr:CTP--2,3-di-O-geranylgeranyl-sn-glycero-1-phosphate cytidyltransferase [Candidatus Woesearchaeota archaeon]
AVGIAVLNNIYIIIGMTAVATVAEVLVEELDDNLIIPLFAGFAGQLIKFAL